jgi:hypothetical protein
LKVAGLDLDKTEGQQQKKEQRPMTTTNPNSEPASVPERIARREQQAEAAANKRTQWMGQFDDGLRHPPENLMAVTLEVRTLAAMTAQLSFEVGRRLLWVQAGMEPGQFGRWVEQESGFARRTAYSHMALARRMIETGITGLGGLPVGKLRALMELDDADLKAIADGAAGAALDRDEVDRMSRTELADKVRSLTKRLEKGRQQLNQAEDRIEQLEREAGQRASNPNAQFVAAVKAVHLNIQQFVERFGDCTTREELAERAGDDRMAAAMLHEINVQIEAFRRLAMLFQPKGRVAEIKGRRKGGANSGAS